MWTFDTAAAVNNNKNGNHLHYNKNNVVMKACKASLILLYTFSWWIFILIFFLFLFICHKYLHVPYLLQIIIAFCVESAEYVCTVHIKHILNWNYHNYICNIQIYLRYKDTYSVSLSGKLFYAKILPRKNSRLKSCAKCLHVFHEH